MDRIKSERYKTKILIETVFFKMVCKMPILKASVFQVQDYVYCNYLLEVFCEMEFLALCMLSLKCFVTPSREVTLFNLSRLPCCSGR